MHAKLTHCAASRCPDRCHSCLPGQSECFWCGLYATWQGLLGPRGEAAAHDLHRCFKEHLARGALRHYLHTHSCLVVAKCLHMVHKNMWPNLHNKIDCCTVRAFVWHKLLC
jgi:hypothetical protein